MRAIGAGRAAHSVSGVPSRSAAMISAPSFASVFKSSTKLGGSGCWFTFGRSYYMGNMLAIGLEPATPETPSLHHVDIQFRYEPSRRLRFYQYDPIHHDVGIYSVH